MADAAMGGEARITLVAQPGPIIAAVGLVTTTLNPVDLPLDTATALALVVGTGCDVLVLSDDVPTQRALELATELGRSHPEIDVVWLVAPHPTLVKAAMDAGIRRLVDPATDDAGIQGAVAQVAGAARLRRDRLGRTATDDAGPVDGRLVAVVAAKGGVGRTTIAANLAVAVARRHPRQVVLADLDLAAGDVDFVLGLDAATSVASVARAGSTVDSAAAKLALVEHPSGLLILPAPESLVEADAVDTNLLAPTLDALRSSFSLVVVDTPPGAGAEMAAAAEMADDLVLVATPDLGGLRSLRRNLDALDELGLTRARRHLVLNRADHRSGLTAQAIEAAVELPIGLTIPEEREVTQAANQRVPVVATSSRTDAVRALTELARRFDPEPEEPQPRGSARVGAAPGRSSWNG